MNSKRKNEKKSKKPMIVINIRLTQSIKYLNRFNFRFYFLCMFLFVFSIILNFLHLFKIVIIYTHTYLEKKVPSSFFYYYHGLKQYIYFNVIMEQSNFSLYRKSVRKYNCVDSCKGKNQKEKKNLI